MSAYTSGSSFPLTHNDLIDVTTNGYAWYFPAGEPHVLNWSVSASAWDHATLQSSETQQDFAQVFANIAQFIPVSFQFIGYVASTATQYGYQRAYDLGSNLNITFSYNGYFNGKYYADAQFASLSDTARCYFPDSDYNSLLYRGGAGDTWMNYNNPFIASLSFENGTNGFALLMHEVLHGLGLKHPHDDGGTGRPTYAGEGIQLFDRQWISVMSYDKLENGGDGAYTGSMPESPMVFDAIALQYLYGESNLNAGNTTYDLSDYLGDFYWCQWDAGGSDTLDASRLGYGVVVELGFSSASNGWNTHDIGFITTASDYLSLQYVNPDEWTWLWGEYENFTGSAFSDVVLGNELDNSIEGGGGDDYLDGGAGNDVFDWTASARGGKDTMVGGLGDDVYVLDSTDDVVTENSFEGVDTVWVNFDYSIAGLAIENVASYSESPTLIRLTGSDYQNWIAGGPGTDTLMAGGGDDTIVGNKGNDVIDGGAGADTAQFSGRLKDHAVITGATGTTVSARGTNTDGVDTLRQVEALKFDDYAVNLTIQAAAKGIVSSTLTRVMELYVAFFNRTPDADGLEYWIGQVKAGASVESVAEAFYRAGIQFSTFTGYSASMSNADFVNVVYRNVLGRTSGADADGLAYWSAQLASGRATHGSLVSSILDSAHTFKGDPTFGWVANLLDNKIAVANTVAVQWGLNYLSSQEAITKGMAIAAAVTADGTSAAIQLVGVDPSAISLV